MGSNKLLINNILNWQLNDNYLNRSNFFGKEIIKSYYEAIDYLYHKELVLDKKETNILEFSKDGNSMVSGNSDEIIFWNLNNSSDFCAKPNLIENKRNSVVKTLTLNNDSSKIFSGCKDYYLDIYDLLTTNNSKSIFVDSCVQDISNCPTSFDLITFGCFNGNLFLYDSRTSVLNEVFNEKFKEPKFFPEGTFKSVQYHPIKDHILLITSSSKNEIFCFDLRNRQPVFNYYLLYSNNFGVDSARYNNNGNQILVSRKRFCPVIFNANEKYPAFEFDEYGYHNFIKDKNCCFAGPNDEYVVSGSDNFDIFMWKIPKKNESKLTKKINSAKFILKGHKSIVNGVSYNYQKSILASYGIEKKIKFWSPFTFDQNLEPNQNDNFERNLKTRYSTGFNINRDYDTFCIEDSSIIDYFLMENYYDQQTKDKFNFSFRKYFKFDNKLFEKDHKKDYNIELMKSFIINYEIDGKLKNNDVLKKIDQLLNEDSINEDLNTRQMTLLFEIKKIFLAKNFIKNSISYLKKKLRTSKNLKNKIINLNKPSNDKKIKYLKLIRLVMKLILYKFFIIDEDYKKLTQRSIKLLEKLFYKLFNKYQLEEIKRKFADENQNFEIDKKEYFVKDELKNFKTYFHQLIQNNELFGCFENEKFFINYYLDQNFKKKLENNFETNLDQNFKTC